MFKQKWHGLFQKQKGIVLVLLLFLFINFIARHTFYFGFIGNFARLNSFFFGEKPPSLFGFIPFHSFSIILSAICNPYFLIGLFAIYLPLFLLFKKFPQTGFTYNTTDKILVFVAAFILTWEVVTFDYNYFLDSAFYFDRIILILLAFLLLWFPLAAPLFAAFAFVYHSQFNYPIGGFELFDKNLLFEILIMFTAWRYIGIIAKDFTIPFAWLVFCIVSSNYFYCGVAKLMISPHGYEWLFQNNIADLFMNCYLRGWLADVSEGVIRFSWSFFNTFHIPLQALSLLTEISAVFILRNRKLAILILSCFFVMHLAIFWCGSVLFWKWMIMDGILLILIISKKTEDVFVQKKLFIASILVIMSSPVWLKPLTIGWYDTPVNQYFTYEVEDSTGTVYQLEKNAMNPYHQWFQHDRFLWLVNKKCLPITGFGTTGKYRLFNSLRHTSPASLKELEMESGTNHFDKVKADRFADFIKTYFRNRNGRLNNRFFPVYLTAPEHLHNTCLGRLYKNQAAVKKFRVIYNLTFSNQGISTPVERAIVQEIVVD